MGGSWGLYFSMLKIAVLSGISYTGILTLSTVGGRHRHERDRVAAQA